MSRSALKATLIIMVAITACIVALVWSIHTIVTGPTPTCGSSSIYKIVPADNNNWLTVICQNGKTFSP